MRVRWTDRRFNFDFPAGIYPEMIERMRGTPARLEDLFAGLSSETLTAQVDGRWSMQENAGHLLDLESFDPELFQRSALHPRLNVPMRLVDMLFFQAEHDDYHLATISELKRIFHAKTQNSAKTQRKP